MPATSLFGCRLRQLSTDNTLFYFMVAIVQVVWLFIYWIGIVAFSRPQTCEPGTESSGQQWAITFACLALFILQAVVTVAAVLVTLRGTPLEPVSKRRPVGRLTYAYLASLVVNVGLLAWADWAVRASDGSCWSSGDRAMPTSIFFGGLGVLLGQAIGIAVSYNQLGDVKHGNTWHSVTRTGVSSLLHLCGSFWAKHRGPKTTLEELVTELQGLMAGIDADKTDVVAGLACAALLQDEAAAAAAAAAAASRAASCAGQPPNEEQSVKAACSMSVVAAAAGDGSGSSSRPPAADAQLLSWAEGVCAGAAAALPEAAAGAGAQPGAAASLADVQEALRWARYATAAYGARQLYWRRGKQGWWATRRQLGALAAAAAGSREDPLAGWAKPRSKGELRDFAAARDLLGPECPVVHFCSGSEPGGLLPHLVAVDRERRAVVLAIAGNWQRPHAVPQVQTALPKWLLAGGSSGAAVEAGCSDSSATGSGGSWVHADCLEAAEALASELERCQVLQHLLHPAGSGDSGSGADLKGLDCAGWPVVVSGHGLGAGVAVLLALKLQAWQLGPLSVWAHGLPAQLCSADVASSLEAACALTCVVVGDDASPRATSAALGRLVEQAVVGLARLRYCKTGLLAALIAERVGHKRWQGRWYNHCRALRPLGEVPAEALGYLQRFRSWQEQQRQASHLPGRVLWLSRPLSVAVAGEQEAAGINREDSNSGDGSFTEQAWRAAWVGSDEVARWGIRPSRSALADHYTSRLLDVLGGLTAPPAHG